MLDETEIQSHAERIRYAGFSIIEGAATPN